MKRSQNKSTQFHVDSFTRNSLRILVTARASHSLYSRQSNMLSFLWQLLVSAKLALWNALNLDISPASGNLSLEHAQMLEPSTFDHSYDLLFSIRFYPLFTSWVVGRLQCTSIHHWKSSCNFRLCTR